MTPVDLEATPSHVTGSAVLMAADGSFAKPCSGQMTEKNAVILYKILLESGDILQEQEKLRRITVSFQAISYAVTVASDGFVYMIQTRS